MRKFIHVTMRSIPKRLVDNLYTKVYDYISAKGGDHSKMSLHCKNVNDRDFRFIKLITIDELPIIRGMLIKIIQNPTPDRQAIGFVWREGTTVVIIKRNYKGDIIIF